MDWKPTAKDVERVYYQFRAPYDFAASGPLKLPLYKPMTTGMASISDARAQEKVWFAIVTLEHGHLNGERAKRIIARVPDTDIEVILETTLSR